MTAEPRLKESSLDERKDDEEKDERKDGQRRRPFDGGDSELVQGHSLAEDAPAMTSANFAAAQERVLERRRQRELEARNRLANRTSRLPAAASNLPYPLSSLPNRGLALWDTLRGREGTRPAFRVGQVDAELLDEELITLLKGQVGEGLKYFGVRHILN